MNKGKFWCTAVVSAFVSLLAAACSAPKEGSKCTAGQAMCVAGSTDTALTCGASGTFVAMGCRGPKGCTKAGASVMCDDSFAQPGDGCDEEGEPACGVDKKSTLECHGGKFTLSETCKGARGCVVNGEKISCDNDVSDIDDPCHFPGDYACTPDKAMALKCTDGKMKKLNSCRGTKACRVFEMPEEKKIEFVCDDTLAQLGDPCDENGEHACSMDKKAIYECKGNAFAALHDCGGPQGCFFDGRGERFDCDTGAAGAAGTGGVKAIAPAHGHHGHH